MLIKSMLEGAEQNSVKLNHFINVQKTYNEYCIRQAEYNSVYNSIFNALKSCYKPLKRQFGSNTPPVYLIKKREENCRKGALEEMNRRGYREPVKPGNTKIKELAIGLIQDQAERDYVLANFRFPDNWAELKELSEEEYNQQEISCTLLDDVNETAEYIFKKYSGIEDYFPAP